MSILDSEFIQRNITTDDGDPVAYLWSHGATGSHLGDGMMVYAIVQQLRARNCVCLGSGGGFVPRIMTQARADLWEQGIFGGNFDYNYGDMGATYIVDAANEVGGHVYWADEDSFFRRTFYPRFIKDTTENAFYNFFVKQDIQIDYLHIDADHSYEGVKRDFELYSTLVREGGIISIHDTDLNFEKNLIVSEDNRSTWDTFSGPGKFIRKLDSSWEVINLFNEGTVKNKPSSTGFTIVQKRMPRLNLVTVVGDFHVPLTLVQMLRHYQDKVDNVHIVFYETEKGGITYEDFQQYLRDNHVYPDQIYRYSGKVYDWDKVTDQYNAVTSAGTPEDWWIISDCDEFQEWSREPREVMMDCIRSKKTFVTGGFLDRIGEDGEFPEITGPDADLDELFPMVGFFRYPMSGACPNKVVMVKSGQKVCSGQHYAIFDDGTSSWGGNHPLCYRFEKVIVFHFKWDFSVIQRLQETGESGCRYSEEFTKMYEAIKDNDFKIPVQDPQYRVERYSPELGYHSYTRWDEIKSELNKI